MGAVHTRFVFLCGFSLSISAMPSCSWDDLLRPDQISHEATRTAVICEGFTSEVAKKNNNNKKRVALEKKNREHREIKQLRIHYQRCNMLNVERSSSAGSRGEILLC